MNELAPDVNLHGHKHKPIIAHKYEPLLIEINCGRSAVESTPKNNKV